MQGKSASRYQGSNTGVNQWPSFPGWLMTGGWSGGPANTTPDQAWNVNTDFHGFAEICSVDATGIAGVGLTLDLRQTFPSETNIHGSGSSSMANRLLIFMVGEFQPYNEYGSFRDENIRSFEYGNTISALHCNHPVICRINFTLKAITYLSIIS